MANMLAIRQIFADGRSEIQVTFDAHGAFSGRPSSAPDYRLPPIAGGGPPSHDFIPATPRAVNFFTVPPGVRLVYYAKIGRMAYDRVVFQTFRFMLADTIQTIDEKIDFLNRSGALIDGDGRPAHDVLSSVTAGHSTTEMVLTPLQPAEMQKLPTFYAASLRHYRPDLSPTMLVQQFSFQLSTLFIPHRFTDGTYPLSAVVKQIARIFQQHIDAGSEIVLHLFVCRSEINDEFVEFRPGGHAASFDMSAFATAMRCADIYKSATAVEGREEVISVTCAPVLPPVLHRGARTHHALGPSAGFASTLNPYLEWTKLHDHDDIKLIFGIIGKVLTGIHRSLHQRTLTNARRKIETQLAHISDVAKILSECPPGDRAGMIRVRNLQSVLRIAHDNIKSAMHTIINSPIMLGEPQFAIQHSYSRFMHTVLQPFLQNIAAAS